MKKTKILLPILSIAGAAAAATPLVMMTSCSTKKTIELANNTFQRTGEEEHKGYGIGGNFEKGTIYTYAGDFSKWTEEFEKPSKTKWEEWKDFYFFISNKSKSDFNVKTSDIEIVVNGNILNKDLYECHNSQNKVEYILFKQADAQIPYDAKIEIRNLKYTSKVEEGFAYFSATNHYEQ